MTAYDVGLLILRAALGVTMAAHGYNKFFGGGRIKGTAGWFDSIGMKPGAFHARVAASTEMAAGVGLAVGLLTPIPAAGFIALMLVAAWTVHRHNGFFIVKEGWEYNLILGAAAAAVAATGAGRFSLDHLLFSGAGFSPWLSGWGGLLVALVLGLAGGIGQLAIFYRPPTQA
ncbi:DoxX family protein [Mycolicibacterium sp. 120266]|uniref:DoxX family protein n=1 Tax=Mycolicibacterium sp. 120266 TaxID=3090601 RepID=UPI00299D9395|nr:DoxX family protein [Mycolicibacterium sp. 120266]MDX1873833.1 DoxX family protein [Mycolicibacterium sp. 120266]